MEAGEPRGGGCLDEACPPSCHSGGCPGGWISLDEDSLFPRAVFLKKKTPLCINIVTCCYLLTPRNFQ